MNIKKSSFKTRFRIVWLFGIVCLILAIVHCANDPIFPSDIPLTQALRELRIGYTPPDHSNSVMTHVILPTNVANGVSVAWTSSDSNVIAIDGTVTRPPFDEGNAQVTLTATLSKGAVINTKRFILTVMALPDPDIQIVSNAKGALSVGYTSPDTDSNSVTRDVTLSRLGTDRVRISWVSSAPEIIDLDGTVIRPPFFQGTTQVTLTATLRKGAVTNTKTFILTVIARPDTDGQAVNNAKDALVIGYNYPDTDSNSVTTDVILRTRGADRVQISWTSSHPEFISTNGEVTRPPFAQGTTQVTLTATLSRGTATNPKPFILTVMALSDPDIQTVSNANNALMIGYTSPDTERSVTTNVTLPISGADNVRISWMSSAPEVITTNGTVTRPPFDEGNAQVTLTAMLSKGAVTNTKIFTLTVIALSIADADAVSNASNALEITYTGVETPNAVSNDVLLAANASDGVSITWTSSHSSFIATDGMVTRPDFTRGDQTVILTAVLFRGIVTNTKIFTLTVIALPLDPDVAIVSNAKNALAIGYTSPDTDSNSVTRDVTLDVTLPVNATNFVDVSWMSSDTNIIAIDETALRPHRTIANVLIIDGIVTRPAFGQPNAMVTLTATLSKGAVTNTKTFILTVMVLPDTDGPAVSNARSALAIGYTAPDTDSNSVTKDVTLPTNIGDDVKISWMSSDTNIIAIEGTVTRPAFGESDATVTLTATLSKGAATNTKTFILTVASLNDPSLIDISTVDQLNAIQYDLDGNGQPDSSFSSSEKQSYRNQFPALDTNITYRGYELVTNLDFAGSPYTNGGTSWRPINDFNAVFEGNGHTISGLFIFIGWRKVGLFSDTKNNAKIRRLGLINPDVTGTTQDMVGALVGYNESGTITECYVQGGTVRGVGDVGGLVGRNGGSISKSYSTAYIPHGEGQSSQRNRHGGFVGQNDSGGTIRACYSTGNVEGNDNIGAFVGLQKDSGSLIEACYTIGRASGDANWIGAFDGRTTGGTISNSYYNRTGTGIIGGSKGKTITQLQNPTGYTGIYATWDDKDVDGDGTTDASWDFGTSSDYPKLKVDFNRDGIATVAEFGNQNH